MAALLSSIAVGLLTHLWDQPLHVPFQYAHLQGDDEADATLDLMLIKNVHEHGWFSTNPKLNAPFSQHWAEWPMGGDLLAYTIKKGIVEATGDVPLTFNLFWLLTFPLTALAAFPVLRKLRVSWSAAVVGATLFSLAPYHFRNGAGHENLAFYVGIPIVVLLCLRILGPDGDLPAPAALRHRAGWWRLRWLLLGTVLIAVTGIYYLAFLLTLIAICALITVLAGRGFGRLVVTAVFAVTGLVASTLANFPTLAYRAQHAANLLGVPDRRLGVSEDYPLRIVELMSPVTAHRFPPFAWLADHLYAPNQQGMGTAMLGLAAGIGFVVALVTLIRHVVRRGKPGSWNLEARIGVLMLVILVVGIGGGVSRALELVGLSGVRAWTRIAIVMAFAGIVVFGRLLDRLRVRIVRPGNSGHRAVWVTVCAVVLVVGILDQTSPALMPHPAARADLWYRNQRFVDRLERALPTDAMVFQLPVTDFPEHGAIESMSAHDEIKAGYLHSRTLRWSAGGIRGRSGEWQWPAANRTTRSLVRGLAALGFDAITLNRDGYAKRRAPDRVHHLTSLLGPPIAHDHRGQLAWDIGHARAQLLAGTTAEQRHRVARQMLDAPQVFLASDVDPIRNRGASKPICAHATALIVNPWRHSVDATTRIEFVPKPNVKSVGRARLRARHIAIPMAEPRLVRLRLRPGINRLELHVDTPDTRCASVTTQELSRVSVSLPANR